MTGFIRNPPPRALPIQAPQIGNLSGRLPVGTVGEGGAIDQNASAAFNIQWTGWLKNLQSQLNLRETGFTVAHLPSNPTLFMRCFATDANATTFASIIAGGGANKVPVYWDGSNWRIG